jgi:hypothetical protein
MKSLIPATAAAPRNDVKRKQNLSTNEQQDDYAKSSENLNLILGKA